MFEFQKYILTTVIPEDIADFSEITKDNINVCVIQCKTQKSTARRWQKVSWKNPEVFPSGFRKVSTEMYPKSVYRNIPENIIYVQ